MSLDEAKILELGKLPISDAAPCGQDVADDEEYLALGAELTKLDRIDLGEPDWRLIEQSALSILRTKSKDIEAACALGFALWRRERYAGLAAALGTLGELVGNYWDNLFPTRPRRRKARIEALLDRLVEGGYLSGEGQPRPDEFDAVDACMQRVEQIKAGITAKMADDPPDFNKFARKIKEMAAGRPKADEPAAAPAEAAAAPTAPRPAASGGGFAAGEIKDASGAVSAINTAVTYLRKADAANPLPYAISRLIKWGQVELPTPDLARKLEAPDKALVDMLGQQLANKMWEPLLHSAESAFRSNDPRWLDLQRYICTAMQNLGAQFGDARAMVLMLTAGVVKRLGSGLYELAFRTGTPLCSGETKLWIETEVVPPPSTGGGSSASDGKLSEAWDGARKLAGSGKLAEAVKALQEGLAGCGQARDRFLWRLRIAQLCFDAQRLQLALPLLEECYDDVKRYHIDEWEASLAVEVAQVLYRCRRALTLAEKQPAAEELSRMRATYAWLCQLDPSAALAVEAAGP